MPDPAEIEFIELEITPIPPDTIDSVKNELVPLIEASLRQSGYDQLLNDERQMRILQAKTFPTDGVIIIGAYLLSKIAFSAWKEFVVPALKAKFGVKQRHGKGKTGQRN